MKNSSALMRAMRDVRAEHPRIDLLNPRTFVANLVFLQNLIAASEHLLEMAITRANGPLLDYYRDHLEEERAHEKWLADDLLSVGVNVAQMPISVDAAAMAGSQYYLIFHVDPVALLGYMAALECFPMSAEQIEALESVHGEKLCRTLRYHSLHDVNHGADLLKTIDGLDEQSFQLVVQNAVRTTMHLGWVNRQLGSMPSV